MVGQWDRTEEILVGAWMEVEVLIMSFTGMGGVEINTQNLGIYEFHGKFHLCWAGDPTHLEL